MKNTAILIDTNIAVDFFDDREPFRANAEKVFDLCAAQICKGFIAAHSITNIFYILRKKYDARKRKEILLLLCEIFEVVSIDLAKLRDALHSDSFTDIEDCLQVNCAAEVNADYIVTRDISGFTGSRIPVISPEDFLKLTEQSK